MSRDRQSRSNVKLHEDEHKQLIVLLTIHSHACLCLCFNLQNSTVITPKWLGVHHVRKHYIDFTYLPRLDLQVHRRGRHNCFGQPVPMLYCSIKNVGIYRTSCICINNYCMYDTSRPCKPFIIYQTKLKYMQYIISAQL